MCDSKWCTLTVRRIHVRALVLQPQHTADGLHRLTVDEQVLSTDCLQPPRANQQVCTPRERGRLDSQGRRCARVVLVAVSAHIASLLQDGETKFKLHAIPSTERHPHSMSERPSATPQPPNKSTEPAILGPLNPLTCDQPSMRRYRQRFTRTAQRGGSETPPEVGAATAGPRLAAQKPRPQCLKATKATVGDLSLAYTYIYIYMYIYVYTST